MSLKEGFPAAEISADGRYRYFLSRQLSTSQVRVAFVGLNPSTADAVSDDPTIRRCRSFALAWGAGELWMVNLFAYRSAKPVDLRHAIDPVGSENDAWLERTLVHANIVVAAWGNHGCLFDRAAKVVARFPGKLVTFGLTKSGMPRHPLYVKTGTELRPFSILPSSSELKY